MVLLVVLFGVYMIAVAGYYKFAKKMGAADESLTEYIVAYPRLIKGIFLIMAFLWPVMVYGFLFKEASKSNA